MKAQTESAQIQNIGRKNIKCNMERDKEVDTELAAQGWTVLRFWEKDIRKNTDMCVQAILTAIEERSTL